jgi:LPS export ABC transporter protein LptC
MTQFTKFLLLTVFAFLSASCKDELEEAPKVDLPVSIEEGESVQAPSIIYSDSGVVRAIITAPLMRIIPDNSNPYKSFPQGVRADFFDGSQRPTSTISAKEAMQYDYKRQILLRDSVVFSNATDRLETEEMLWEEYKQRISSTKFVKINRPDEIIYGYGFESNPDFSKWKIHSITGRLRVEDFNNGNF